MIVDACLYNGESDMLRLRMMTLQRVVDQFVVVTCSHTHQGEAASVDIGPVYDIAGPLDVRASLVMVGADDLAANMGDDRGGVGSAWYQRIERRHRDEWVRTARSLLHIEDDDVVMVSDVDEIPRPSAVLAAATYARHGARWLVMEQRFHGFAMDYLHPVQPWLGTCVSTSRNLAPQAQRDARGDANASHYVNDGGWHLSWFGTADDRRRKLHGFSHAELSRAGFDPERAYIDGRHSNGEELQRIDAARLSWPDPIIDGRFTVPAYWRAPSTESGGA